MTQAELEQIYYLPREIMQLRERREKIMAQATKTNAEITGMPHGQGISDKPAKAVDLAQIDAEIEARTRQMIQTERYIAGIPDCLTRMIIRKRYVDGCSWVKVAHAVGGGNTEDSVRKIAIRYLMSN